MTAKTTDTLQKIVVPILLALLTPLVIGGWNLKANRSELAAVKDSVRMEAQVRWVADSAWKASTSTTLQQILTNTAPKR